jgi:molecular chaperone DnaK
MAIKFPADKKAPIEAGLAKLKEAYSAKNFDAIETAQTELNAAWATASEEMYKAAGDAPQGGEPQGNAAGQDHGDTVTDVDFEEVKDEK